MALAHSPPFQPAITPADCGRVVILGAGPCGLGAAHRLSELGYRNFTVFEAQDRVGGLSGSVRDENGFTWDYACHVQFSNSPIFTALMDDVLRDEWIVQRRDAQIWIGGRFVPYPLQYNVHHLPPAMRQDCVDGLIATHNSPAETPADFGAWIDHAFGEGIARHFMRPYNDKVWAVPLETMSVAWIAERVARPDLARVLANLEGTRKDDDWGPNAFFRFPREGGTGAVWDRVAARVTPGHMRLNRPARRIDSVRREVHFDDGVEPYDVLLSTLPLDRLVRMADRDDLAPAAAALSASDVYAIGIGIEGSPPAHMVERRWMYCPDPTLNFHRVGVLSNFAPAMAPPGHWSLLCEVSRSPWRTVDEANVVEGVIAGLRREGMIAPDARIASRWKHLIAPGYPTPTRGRDAALGTLLPALEADGIYSRGRFGAWTYEVANQDHCFMQGHELIERLLLGTRERTFVMPRA